jgi:small-conductance mechanosensitive channel
MEELKGKSEALIRINLGMVENMKENDELKSQLENAMQINSDAEEYKSLLEKENQALRTNSER